MGVGAGVGGSPVQQVDRHRFGETLEVEITFLGELVMLVHASLTHDVGHRDFAAFRLAQHARGHLHRRAEDVAALVDTSSGRSTIKASLKLNHFDDWLGATRDRFFEA